MATRRLLNSVADGTARAFATRNNDVDGWWAPGLLLATVPAADPDYEADLVDGRATPDLGPTGLGALGPAWARYLRWSLARHGLGIEVVRSATLTVRFDREVEVGSWLPGGRDHPFRCSVVIVDDRGRKHAGVAEGHCSRPDDFSDPNPYWRPRRGAIGPGARVLDKIGERRVGPLAGRLPDAVAETVLTFRESSMGAHRVTLVLRDGSKIPGVVIAWGRVLFRGPSSPDFRVEDIVDVIDETSA